MIGLYIKSVIVYLIIFWALKKIVTTIMFSRKDINYRDYAKGRERNVLHILFYTNFKIISDRYYIFCCFC